MKPLTFTALWPLQAMFSGIPISSICLLVRYVKEIYNQSFVDKALASLSCPSGLRKTASSISDARYFSVNILDLLARFQLDEVISGGSYGKSCYWWLLSAELWRAVENITWHRYLLAYSNHSVWSGPVAPDMCSEEIEWHSAGSGSSGSCVRWADVSILCPWAFPLQQSWATTDLTSAVLCISLSVFIHWFINKVDLSVFYDHVYDLVFKGEDSVPLVTPKTIAKFTKS